MDEQKKDLQQQVSQEVAKTNPSKKDGNNKKKSVFQKLLTGLNVGKNVLSTVTQLSGLGANTIDNAKKAAFIVKRLVSDIKRVKGRNAPAWYLRYGPITPAANTSRLMDPIFNTSITKNASNGVCKMVDVYVEWTGYAQTYVLDQVVLNAYQSLRRRLKSNLPYSQNRVRAFFIQGIALAIIAKMLERDVHWSLKTDEKDANFQLLMNSISDMIGTYGFSGLQEIEYLMTENWPETSSIYDKFVGLYNANVTLPPILGEFISHYFGTVFTSSQDGNNDAIIKLVPTNVDWCEIDKDDNITYSTKSVTGVTIEAFMATLRQYAIDFGMVIADMSKAVKLNACKITSYDEYVYYKVYDETFLQALINGYTSDSCVTDKSYIRLDLLTNSDPFTQFLFMGGLQPSDDSLSKIKTIKILSMCLKFYSDSSLEWPADLVESNSAASRVFERPFGLNIVTDMYNEVETISNVSTDGNDRDVLVPQDNTSTNMLDRPNKTQSIVARKCSFEVIVPRATGYNATINIGNPANPNRALYLPILRIIKDDTHFYDIIAAGIGDCTQVKNRIVLNKLFWCYKVGNPNDFTKMSSVENDSFYVSTDGNLSNAVKSIFNYNTVGELQTLPNTLFSFFISAVDNGPYGSRVCQGYFILNSSNSPNAHITVTNNAFIYNVSGAGEFSVAPFYAWHFHNIYNTVVSVSMQATISTSLTQIAAPQSSYLGLAAYVADIFDWHIPIALRTKIKQTVYYNNVKTVRETNVAKENFVLVKENYVPYYYNTYDLIPVLYKMFVSLFNVDKLDERAPNKNNFRNRSNFKKDSSVDSSSTSKDN